MPAGLLMVMVVPLLFAVVAVPTCVICAQVSSAKNNKEIKIRKDACNNENQVDCLRLFKRWVTFFMLIRLKVGVNCLGFANGVGLYSK
jgi:hypothetical protein